MDRRHFIKLTAITGTTAALPACGNPENQVIRFIPEDDLVPGVATWKPSICPLCAAGCGVIARVMEGDAEVFRNGQAGVIRMGLAKKLEGNPEDAISQGKLCARGQAAIQITYHPDRLDSRSKRTGERGSGQFAEITWDEAIKELTGKLNELAARTIRRRLAFLRKPRRGRRLELVARVAAALRRQAAGDLRIFLRRVLRRANAISFGSHQLATVDLESARYFMISSARISSAPGIPRSRRAWPTGDAQGGAGVRPKFVHVDARLSQTAANADEFVAASPAPKACWRWPGVRHAARQAAPGVGGWPRRRPGRRLGGGLPDYTPAEVEKTGVPPEDRAAGARVRGERARQWRSSAARRSRTPTVCSMRRRSTH